jgi:fucose 4-O-acetylase-like acetyltransferase
MALSELAQAARPRSAIVAHTTAHLAFIDNLRILLAALVVAHHAGQAYGPTGGDWPIFNPTRAAILGPFFTVNASFFMGLFFLIAGYFVPQAYDRKGVASFLTDRLIRLGIPMVFVSLGLFLPLAYAADGHGQAFGPFLANYLRRPEVGHMWFAGHLIIYACGYAVWRWLTDRTPSAPSQSSVPPGHRQLLGYALGLAVVAFIVRLAFPIDRWVEPAPFVRAELAHVPQYLSLFIFGIMAYRRDWLRQLPAKTGMVWLTIGLAAAALPYTAAMLRELTPIDINLSAGGGLSLSALARSTIEAFICVGLCVGLLALFRERVNQQGALLRNLAAGSYTVYISHIVLVVGLQMALAASNMPPLAKFGVVTFIAMPLCFTLAYGLRKLPGVARVL